MALSKIINNFIAIVEVRQEIGRKGSEPYAQVILHYTHSTLVKEGTTFSELKLSGPC